MRSRSSRQRRDGIRPDVIITVTYRRIRGQMRQVFHVRFAPLETQRFPWGIPCGKTLVEARAKRYARAISEYINSWTRNRR